MRVSWEDDSGWTYPTSEKRIVYKKFAIKFIIGGLGLCSSGIRNCCLVKEGLCRCGPVGERQLQSFVY